jgi:hypothetical protein
MGQALRVARMILIALLFILPLAARGQGCSLCRDSTAGSAPRARQGLRRAILVLGIPAGAIFLGALLLARRSQPRED